MMLVLSILIGRELFNSSENGITLNINFLFRIGYRLFVTIFHIMFASVKAKISVVMVAGTVHFSQVYSLPRQQAY